MLTMRESTVVLISALALLGKINAKSCFVVVIRRLIYSLLRNRVFHHPYLNFAVSERASLLKRAATLLAPMLAKLSSILLYLRNQLSSRMASMMRLFLR